MELPRSVTFCPLVSEEDSERRPTRSARRAASSTAATAAPRWPRGGAPGEPAEREQRGLLSRLWAKFCAVQGELNCCNSLGVPEMPRRQEQLKKHIHRLPLYSGCQEEEKEARTHPFAGPTNLCMLAISSAGTSVVPPTATTMAAPVAPASPVYTMTRVFGPFPVLPSKPPPGGSDPLVLSPGGFHLSHLAGNSSHKVHGPDFPWTSACSDSHSTEEMPSPPVKASIFNPLVLLKVQPVPRPKDDSENDPGSIEPMPHERDP
ncbi:LOW QUALITY PROTEIN: hypothetical protein MC885_004009 [Smutsia gigantea]|nr:LOW QUALITY PROTEIN: hypothetical protein MC885_004009 [Smutsia gigantea]